MFNDGAEAQIEKPKDRRSLKKPDFGDCQICLQRAHGIHFGVLSCRACAAFFRRTVVLSRSYGCRRAEGTCDVEKGERFICRQCRYKKCIRLGMTPDNVQWAKDGAKTTNKRTAATTDTEENSDEDDYEDTDVVSKQIDQNGGTVSENGTDKDVSAPVSISSTFTNGSAIPVSRPLTDLEQYLEAGKAMLVDQISSLMNEFDANMEVPPSDSDSALGRMRDGLEWCRRTQNMQPEIVHVFSIEDCENFFLNNIITTAQWFMFCDEFAQLPLDDKLSIFRSTWGTWPMVEQIDLSLQIFGERFLTEKLTVFTREKAGYVDKIHVDLSSITDHHPDMVRDMMNNACIRIFDAVAKPIKEMKLSLLEIAYMQCQLAFHVEGKAVSDAVQKACVSFRNRISSDLHDYYVKELGQPNYANRLIKIMGLISSIESIQNERTKMLELANMFDVIKINISEENMI